MPDLFTVTASWSSSQYLAGQTITGSISGSATNFNAPNVPLAVIVDRTQPIVDTGPTPRTWVVGLDGVSISATA